jgi:hypothetical protein
MMQFNSTSAGRAAVAASLAFVACVGSARADTGPCALPNGGSLPDLVVDAATLAQYLSVSDEKFAASSCAVQEGFVTSPGWHALLRFTSSTPNIGLGALVIGDPATCGNLYTFSSCHGHLHFKEYADYRLWTTGGYDTWAAIRDLSSPTNTGSNAAYLAEAAKGKQLLDGRKMGFCMIDSVRYASTASATPTFTSCTLNQGLSVGWSDRYDARLDGQYVQLDNLKEGLYVLEVHVNPEHLLPESNYTNNSSAVRVRYLPQRGQTPATLEVLP